MYIFFLEIFPNWAYADPHPTPTQKWPSLHERCGMCWIEWKNLFQIFPIFILRVMVDFLFKIHQKLINFEYKNSHISEKYEI